MSTHTFRSQNRLPTLLAIAPVGDAFVLRCDEPVLWAISHGKRCYINPRITLSTTLMIDCLASSLQRASVRMFKSP
jgi:hypothetical protein